MMWLSVIDEVWLLFLGTLKHIHVLLSLAMTTMDGGNAA